MLSADQARQYQAAQKNTMSKGNTTTTSNSSSSSSGKKNSSTSALDASNYFNQTGREKLDITKEEMDKIEKCMKDPEFLKLFEDYVNEISDPNALRETDMYIKQLEKEGTTLPKSILIPKACFCIQCGTEDKKGKNHIVNVCSSDNVEIYKEEKAKKGDKSGTQFSVPLVVGNPKVEEKQVILDVVFNTKTCERAEKDVLFKDFICGMALDYVEKKCNVKLKKQYYTMMLGVKSVGEPSALTIQAPGQTPEKKDPLAPQNVLKDIQESRVKTKESSTEQMELKMPKEESVPKKSNLIQEVNDPITPKYEIVYRNSFDMSEYTYSTPTASNRAKPSEIGIRIFLPMLDNISGVDLDVSENFLKLDCSHPQKYHLDLHLPYSVQSDKVSAKFEKKTKTLKVNLIVTPDPVQKVVFEEIPKEEEEEEKPLIVEESSSKVEEVSETVTEITQTEFKLSQAPSPHQFSSFVQKTPQEIDIAATDLKPVNIEPPKPQTVNRVKVNDTTTKKSVSFAPTATSEESKPVQPTSEFKNKYLFELD